MTYGQRNMLGQIDTMITALDIMDNKFTRLVYEKNNRLAETVNDRVTNIEHGIEINHEKRQRDKKQEYAKAKQERNENRERAGLPKFDEEDDKELISTMTTRLNNFNDDTVMKMREKVSSSTDLFRSTMKDLTF